MDFEIIIPDDVASVMAALERGGFEVWCVGGCVRDSLLGAKPYDWDLTTSALPDEILRCCENFRTIETGIKHGTVTVISGEMAVEVTTFRKDGGYIDHRHPDSTEFSRRLCDDLSRRDFTVNSLAYHPKRGLADEFNGVDDLENRVLRCVGEPAVRFDEDALRILRCLRFAAKLGFEIESETAAALRECSPLLAKISCERVRDELTKLLCGEFAAEILRQYADVIFAVLPELAPMKNCTQETVYHRFDVWEHCLHAVEFSPRVPVLRWAALLHDCGKPSVKFFDESGVAHFYGHDKKSAEIAENLLKRLRFSNREIDEIVVIISHHGERAPLPKKRIKRLLGSLGEATVRNLFTLMKADLSAKADGLFDERIGAIEECERIAEEILTQGECLTLKDLAVNGNDLINLGVERGVEIGKALNFLLDEVMSGNVANEKDNLKRLLAEKNFI